MTKQLSYDPHPFHIVGECDDCCTESEALRLGYPDQIQMGDCETAGCINAAASAMNGTDDEN